MLHLNYNNALLHSHIEIWKLWQWPCVKLIELLKHYTWDIRWKMAKAQGSSRGRWPKELPRTQVIFIRIQIRFLIRTFQVISKEWTIKTHFLECDNERQYPHFIRNRLKQLGGGDGGVSQQLPRIINGVSDSEPWEEWLCVALTVMVDWSGWWWSSNSNSIKTLQGREKFL